VVVVLVVVLAVARSTASKWSRAVTPEAPSASSPLPSQGWDLQRDPSVLSSTSVAGLWARTFLPAMWLPGSRSARPVRLAAIGTVSFFFLFFSFVFHSFFLFLFFSFLFFSFLFFSFFLLFPSSILSFSFPFPFPFPFLPLPSLHLPRVDRRLRIERRDDIHIPGRDGGSPLSAWASGNYVHIGRIRGRRSARHNCPPQGSTVSTERASQCCPVGRTDGGTDASSRDRHTDGRTTDCMRRRKRATSCVVPWDRAAFHRGRGGSVRCRGQSRWRAPAQIETLFFGVAAAMPGRPFRGQNGAHPRCR